MIEICNQMETNTKFIVAILAYMLLEWWLGKTKFGSTLTFIIMMFVGLISVIIKIKGNKHVD